MGFFTDLKDDLSQAVNELKPADGKAVGDTVIPEAVEGTAGEDNSKGQTVAVSEELSNISHTDTESHDKKEDTPGGKASDELAVITAGMIVNGDITSEGSVDLIGTVIGNINILGKLNVTGCIQGDSKAVEIYAENAQIFGELSSQGGVRIGNGSVIIGNLFANSAVISGAVRGDIDIHGPVLLDSTAIVMGNIRSQSIQINNGAVIEGMCSQCYSEVRPSDFFEEFNKGKR
ncbi:bactofilin family protein [Kineothrix sp. MB12-C1]|uniref:bactofilin family protein n=1 Tax=Kineothrix sp. MB12-C1 TaxID=3070215 RepID=UPI0027D320DE|nr:polymer-forming cytoskeletal protein [Kineothrix sp. MB12-C1]WMC92973.1 polymer-forming cytoskeletal protein [Kineothrix sp. MB12-C1]